MLFDLLNSILKLTSSKWKRQFRLSVTVNATSQYFTSYFHNWNRIKRRELACYTISKPTNSRCGTNSISMQEVVTRAWISLSASRPSDWNLRSLSLCLLSVSLCINTTTIHNIQTVGASSWESYTMLAQCGMAEWAMLAFQLVDSYTPAGREGGGY